MSPSYGIAMKSLLVCAGLAAALLTLQACGKKSEPPAPASSSGAAPASGDPNAAVKPSTGDIPSSSPATGPAAGGTAIGGMAGGQDQGGAKSGGTPAATGGDGASGKPATAASQ